MQGARFSTLGAKTPRRLISIIGPDRRTYALGVTHLVAPSRQAKDKIERGFGTFQNRLVTLLAHANVTTWTQADEILQLEIRHQISKLSRSTKPNQVWITDITYIPTKEGWLFVAAEIDLFRRSIRGWAACDNTETTLVIEALDQAGVKTPWRLAGLIHHSDRSSQYASEIFTSVLAHLAMDQSMSRRANCYDNATAESFWATLKSECFNNTLPVRVFGSTSLRSPRKKEIPPCSTIPFAPCFRAVSDPIVQRLGHRPFTAVTRVRIPLGSLSPRGFAAICW